MARETAFTDRRDAGRRLAAALATNEAVATGMVCGIPRGGVVVAASVAEALGRPLRAVVARKVGAPGHAELAVGAVGPDGIAVLDEGLLQRVGATRRWLDGALERARAEVSERMEGLHGVVDAAAVAGQHVVVVDDGVATGATAAAVGRWLAHAGAARRILALPVGPPDTLSALEDDYDEVFALAVPQSFVAVGQWYRDFTQVTDDEVRRLLDRA